MPPTGSPNGTPTTAPCSTHSGFYRTSASPASSMSAGRPARPKIARARRSPRSRPAFGPTERSPYVGFAFAQSIRHRQLFLNNHKFDAARLGIFARRFQRGHLLRRTAPLGNGDPEHAGYGAMRRRHRIAPDERKAEVAKESRPISSCLRRIVRRIAESVVVLAVVALHLRPQTFGEAPHFAADFPVGIFDRDIVVVVMKPRHVAGLAMMRPRGPHRDA